MALFGLMTVKAHRKAMQIATAFETQRLENEREYYNQLIDDCSRDLKRAWRRNADMGAVMKNRRLHYERELEDANATIDSLRAEIEALKGDEE